MRLYLYVYMCGYHVKQSIVQPGKLANTGRGQLNREIHFFSVLVCALESYLARQVRPSPPASACSITFSTFRLNRVLTHGIRPAFRGGVHLFIPPSATVSVTSFIRSRIAYRWRSLPRVRRHRASCSQGSSSNGCCLFRFHDGPIT